MSCVGVSSDGIMFIPNFVKISQLVKKFIWGTCTVHTQHGNLKDIHFPSVNKQSRVEWKYCITILLHKSSKASTYINTATYFIVFYWQCSVAGWCHTTNIQITCRILTVKFTSFKMDCGYNNNCHLPEHKMCCLQT